MRHAFMVFACGVVVAIGVRFWMLEPPIHNTPLDMNIGEDVVITGTVVREPSHKENNQRLLVETKEGVRIAVSAERYPVFRYGDEIQISGVLKKPEPFETDTGRMFAYDKYLEKDGIVYQMLYPHIETLSSDGGNILFRALFAVRRAFLASIGRMLPEPNASLLAGITIGAEDGLGEELEEQFRAVGLVHVIVLSGYNITIVSDTITRLLIFLPRLFALSGGAIAVVLFVIMAGASAATVRSALMALLVVIARALGRRYDVGRALFIAGSAMVLHNPRILLYDPSFQLSFLATIGLVYGSPLVEKWFLFLPERFGFRESAISTTATQLFVLPFLLYHTGQLSMVSLPANIAVLWTMPMAMLATFLTGTLGMFSYWLAFFPALLGHLISNYVLGAVNLFSNIPFASIIIPPLHPSILILTYTALCFWIVWKRKSSTKLTKLHEA